MHSCVIEWRLVCSHEEGEDPKEGPNILYGDGKKKHNIKAKRFYEHSDSPKADIFHMVQKKRVRLQRSIACCLDRQRIA